ncbi:MAG TPA: hypothetical protein VNE82_00710 [Candidatus Binataceae bacterium]|nr:hypothetical protein [Candidatus Binataceae bacterium]
MLREVAEDLALTLCPRRQVDSGQAVTLHPPELTHDLPGEFAARNTKK